MDKKEVQKALIELIGENENERKSEIPRNVDSSYKVMLNLNLKELAIVFSPFYTVLPLALLIIVFTNTLGIVSLLTTVFIVVVLFMFIYGLLTISPIKERQNMKMYHHLLNKKRFNDRQKVFFIEGRSDK